MHVLVIAAASSLVLAAVTLARAQAQPAGEVVQVKTGTASPLSGPSAHAGKDIENGVRMAIDELNTKGIMLGGSKVQ